MDRTAGQNIPRRTFLSWFTGTAFLGLAAGAAVPGSFRTRDRRAGASPLGLRLDEATCALFAPHRGELFTVVQPDGGRVPLKLVEAVEAPAHWRPESEGSLASRRSFSLLFHGPADARIGPSSVLMKHATLGEFSLLLVPIGPASATSCYEAVFG